MSFPRYPAYKDSGVEWLGRVPEHWSVDRMKWSTASRKNGIWGDDAKQDENDIACVRVADFDRQRLSVILSDPTVRNVTPKERVGRVLSHNDLLLEKSGGGETQPVGCVVIYEDHIPAVCSNFVSRVTLAATMNSSYWRYLHFAAYAVRLNTRSIKQTSGIQNLDDQQYFDERCVFPPAAEQDAIAVFLDHETAKIDALIAEQQRLIELLNEKRQAVISHAVTKGLNPNAPMKPSGVEWLGDMPEHWALMPLKRNLLFLTSGSRGWADHYADDGDLFLRITNLTRGSVELDLSDIQRVCVPVGAEGARTLVQAGDVLFSITAYLGSVAVVPEELETAYVSQHVALARLRPAQVHPKWVGYVALSSVGKTWFEQQSYGGTKIQLSLDDVRNLPVPVPPVSEQLLIVAFVDSKLEEFGRLKAESLRAIDVLQERRSALISAAVTGQIDVRGFASQEAA